jgi:maltooligosyltrehalose trehalohydrolase
MPYPPPLSSLKQAAHMGEGEPVQFGAELCEHGVSFRLWAPAQSKVDLILESSSGHELMRLAMQPESDGWFSVTTDAAATGSLYRYELHDGLRVPDPVSRFQPQGLLGPSEVIDPHEYVWQTPDWRGRPWHEAVIYELHVGAFSQKGDYDGVKERLGHLVSLGITAIQLMPIAAFPGSRDWGYDGVMHYTPADCYGRPHALKALIDAAHQLGLMVFLDVVYNHFGPSGCMLPLYAPQFFERRRGNPWGAGVNYDGPLSRVVREYVIQNARYWLQEYRFDGLRLDATQAMFDDSQPHILEELALSLQSSIGKERYIHLIQEDSDNRAHWYRPVEALALTKAASLYQGVWNDDFASALHVLATGETGGHLRDFADNPLACLARAMAQGFVFQGEHSAWLERSKGTVSRDLSPLTFIHYLQSHDQCGNRPLGERSASLMAPEKLAMITALLLLSPQIPMLFMGAEWATRQPFYFFVDIEDEFLAKAIREGRRAEMRAHPHYLPFLKRMADPSRASTFYSSKLIWDEAERLEHEEFLTLTRDLLAIRQRAIVPLLARLEGSLHPEKGWAEAGLWREYGLYCHWYFPGAITLSLYANFSAHPITIDKECKGALLYSNAPLSPMVKGSSLAAWSIAVYLEDNSQKIE